MSRPHTTAPGLERMRVHTCAGLCPFCLDPVKNNPTGRKSVTCGDQVCRTAYQRCYRRDYRRATRPTGATSAL